MNILFSTHKNHFAIKTLAFTLAETLIVIGVIGIVSALTLPNLNSSTSDKEKLAKFKKVHQNIEDALGRAQAVYGPYSDWFVNDNTYEEKQKRFSERITEFMKVQKTCAPNVTGCFSANKVKSLEGSYESESVDTAYKTSYRYVLADGTSIMFYFDSSFPGYFSALFDIDGANKGKNVAGSDLFELSFSNDTVDVYDDLASASAFGKCYDGYMYACSSWILRTDNMEYLKAESSGKCKNNEDIVLDGTSNITCK